ncbi:P-loop containing nucleoside triphosphate hydrolase protein, partial [Mycena galopus ATCC 62051]
DSYRRQIRVDDQVSLLTVLDTAGVEVYWSMQESWIKYGDGFVLAFRRFFIPPCLRSLVIFLEPNSLTDENSWKELETFLDRIYRIKGSRSVPIVVVGLKSDLRHEREVDAAIIESLSTQWNIPFHEASAKLNWHVIDVFEGLVRQLRLPVQYTPGPDVLNPVMKRGKRQQGSCIIM